MFTDRSITMYVRFWTFLLFGTVIWAAEERVTVPPGGDAEVRFVLGASKPSVSPVLWIQADPKVIAVTVTGPDGRRWTQADFREGAAVMVQLADHKSGSQDEVRQAVFLGSNGTLIVWNPAAVQGTYTLRLSGQNVSSEISVALTRSTLAELMAQKQVVRKQREADFLTSIYPVPERTASLGTTGKASMVLDLKDRDNSDAVIVGTTLGEKFTASIQLPNGTILTEANAQQFGCGWGWNASQGFLAFSFLKQKGPHLYVSCPTQVGAGQLTVKVDAGSKAKNGSMSAAVFRGKVFKAMLEEGEKERAAYYETIQLREKKRDGGDDSNSINAIVNRPTTVRLELAGGPDPVSSATVATERFQVDQSKGIGVQIIGPHPSKTLIGKPVTLAAEADGTFVYSFVPSKLGTVQLDFTANGLFTNGRRFAAVADVQVMVHRHAATVTRVRQQRIDLDSDGKADLPRFLLELNVMEAGIYEASIGILKSKDRRLHLYTQKSLSAGKQTMTIEGDRESLAVLEQDPAAALRVNVLTRTRVSADEYPGLVDVTAPVPTAGQFEAAAPRLSDTRPSGVNWQLVNTDGKARADGLMVSIPVAAEGKSCEWEAWLEVNPKTPSGPIRTVGYQQHGRFTPIGKRARIDTLWTMDSFFPQRSMATGKQAFVFSLKQAHCGPNYVYVPGYMAEKSDEGQGIFTLHFTADLSAKQVPSIAHPITVASAIPRVAGIATVVPLDKDRDGKFDHLKVDYDIESADGACIWFLNVGIHSDTESSARGFSHRSETKPGLNHVSMEVDITTDLSLYEHPLFSMYVDKIKCGVKPEITIKDYEDPPAEPLYVFEQEFAIESGRFAKQGEFKSASAHVLKIPQIFVRDYGFPKNPAPPMPVPPQPTTKHGARVSIQVSSGAQQLGSIDKATAQVYMVDFKKMEQLGLKPVLGPSGYKKPFGTKVQMEPAGNNVYSFEFAHRLPGRYQVEYEVTGKLADGRAFVEPGATTFMVLTEDLKVLSVEQEVAGGVPRVAITIEADEDREIEASASLFPSRMEDTVNTLVSIRLNYVRVKKGVQKVWAPLPPQALELSGKGAVLCITVEPPKTNAPPDLKTTYWQPNVVEWNFGRSGYTRLLLKPVAGKTQ